MATIRNKWCVTEFPSHSVEFEWTIRNFRLITKVVIESAVFTHEGVQWQLQLRRSSQDPYPKKSHFGVFAQNSSNEETWCSLGLCITSATPVSATYKFVIVGDQMKTYSLVQDIAQSFSHPKQFSPIPLSIHCSEIRKYICNGDLRMKCAIDFVSHQSVFHHGGNLVEIPDCDLKTSLTTLLRGGDHSDVTLVVAGGKEFKAHKLILSARSPVFARMFKHGMSESISNRVTIADIAPDTMDELLAYIYTGDAPIFKATDEPLIPAAADLPIQLQSLAMPTALSGQKLTKAQRKAAANNPPRPPQVLGSDPWQLGVTPVTPPALAVQATLQEPCDAKSDAVATVDSQNLMVTFQNLFCAADKYQIDRLKACCESTMNKAITVDNAADTLLFADMHNAAQLKRSCTAFIASNRSKVLTTPGWSKLAERHDLLLSIFQATV